MREASDLLPQALAEMSVEVPSDVTAAATVALRDVARLFLAGRAGGEWVAAKVYEIVSLADWPEDLYDTPLGGLYGLDDEYGQDWGRSAPVLDQIVRAACAAAVASPPNPP